MGNVGSGTVLDFTALGDAVNVGARLLARASTGEVVLAAPPYSSIEEQHPGGPADRLAIRGRDQRVDVVVLATSACSLARLAHRVSEGRFSRATHQTSGFEPLTIPRW